ncbi:LeoA/HP0731 family dynamin-like GTPase [Helicobacter cetorum]|uniref:Labile enterotoxin output A n=1 Tax=Helicobacter cetorum (strain ATCC BAA-429 / MIT 00-7128) TaxID=182217 RepID=I0EMR8_HELC0|nr:LeoA/HP0731 family dynamin-like GTPase [Helicobacter cetorum]AFI04237.1 labile enterotoxin output A [Helicobacter cetorum MIT 00-7128]
MQNLTLQEFKKSQTKSLEKLSKLKDYVLKGQDLGVQIDKNLLEKLQNAINEVQNSKLRVALIGGFSEGKTSIAAAWLEKLDKSSMNISQEESSNEVKTYNVNNEIELVDTPGLFGFKEKHAGANIEKYKDITKKYVSNAHLILYVMNPSNPIKASHKEDLEWLFRTLNLLDRTIFVLGKFDEIADIEDEEDYQSSYAIKKESIIQRLDDSINLSENEKQNLSIIAVSANPFDMGLEHWLNHLEEFKKLSHIALLQTATQAKIESSGGANALVLATKQSIMRDVLHKIIPENEKINAELKEAMDIREDSKNTILKDLDKLKEKIKQARIKLREFIQKYFSDLILQARGTSLSNFQEFFEKEIGKNAIKIGNKINNEFQKYVDSIELELDVMQKHFNAEIKYSNELIDTCLKKTLQYAMLNSKKFINKNTILAGRNFLKSRLKNMGVNVGKSLNFKPWGAEKLTKNLNGIMSAFSIAMELWDSYKKQEEENKFQNGIKELVEFFEEERKNLLDFINSEDFYIKLFPTFIELQERAKIIEEETNHYQAYQQQFNDWVKEGEIIDAEIIE